MANWKTRWSIMHGSNATLALNLRLPNYVQFADKCALNVGLCHVLMYLLGVSITMMFHCQCDCVDVGINRSQILPKSYSKSSHCNFKLIKWHFQKNSQKVAKYLGYFCTQICHQDLSKIAQSGHRRNLFCNPDHLDSGKRRRSTYSCR